MRLVQTIILLLFTSCMTADYHLDVNGGVQSYTENYPEGLGRSLSSISGVDVIVVEGDDKKFEAPGTGYRIALSEETKIFITKIGYNFAKLDPVVYQFNIDGANIKSTTNISSSSFYVSLGLNFDYIKPYVSMRNLKMQLTQELSGDGAYVPNLSGSTEGSVLGWGIDLDIPLNKYINLYASYSKESSNEDFVDYEAIGLGLRVYLTSIEGMKIDKSK